ncbi:unnamed protein product [Microthlaspi erraticum]|uniref:Knottin scorpion toxin-like domain-containing protein n=1 Tax=Microthlaspi erraticum TaxID=1685480 RepID=A0A6D2L635_9BRAS|nr:unnamed protein product [Microthlaspi erraticum]
MAKTLNSICFTALLLVVLLISAEIPKSEAQAQCNRFLGEASGVNPCTRRACEARCPMQYTGSCRAACEVHDGELHCHCYAR